MQNGVEMTIKQILRECDDREAKRRWREWGLRAASALFCLILFETAEHYALANSSRSQSYYSANDRPVHMPLPEKKLVEGCGGVSHLVGRECDTQSGRLLSNSP